MIEHACPLTTAARRDPHQFALVDARTGNYWTYLELDTDANRIAAALQSEEVGPGSRVAWVVHDPIESIRLIWGCLRAGITACPLSSRWPESAQQRACEQAGVDTVVQRVGPGGQLLLRPTVGARPKTELVPTRLATVIFSSGSTGTPKAVAHTLAAHRMSAEGSNRNLPLTPGDRWLLSLPLFHVGGLGILFRCAVAGAALVVAPRANQSLVHDNPLGITHASFVPTQLLRLVEPDPTVPRGLKGVLLGGAPLPQPLIATAHEAGWPLCNTYGMSEMASQVTATMPHANRAELKTCGRPLLGRELRVETDGQLAVRGDTLMSGYVQGNSVALPLNKTGWFVTGDYGRLDEQNRLVVTGRHDNLFISGGENIYPEEIEQLLLEIPGIRQAVVVPVPHHEYGARPVAFVDAFHPRPAEWKEILAAKLPRFKLPDRYLAWIDSSGLKPNRRDLAHHAAQQNVASLPEGDPGDPR